MFWTDGRLLKTSRIEENENFLGNMSEAAWNFLAD
jgi:hypothetical protein